MKNSYTEIVTSLNAGPGSGGNYVQKRIPGVSVSVFAALRLSDGLEALLFELELPSLDGIESWPDSGGVEVEREPVSPDSRERVRLILQVTEEKYRDVFHVLCEDVITIITPEVAEKNAVRAMHARFVRWQAFLKKNRPDGLSPESQVGLFGELHILRELFLPRVDPVVVLQAWRGCKGANQDFQFVDRALEVKTSRASILDRVSISNVQQLNEDGMVPLLLTVVQVHSNETNGETLPEIVQSLRARLPDDALDLLDEGLMDVGYLDVHEQLYEKTRYQLNGVIHHEVKDGFPRLLRKNLPEGVKKVRYEISLDAARNFRIDEKAVHEIFEGVKSASGD